jgi:hypothetical protein
LFEGVRHARFRRIFVAVGGGIHDEHVRLARAIQELRHRFDQLAANLFGVFAAAVQIQN